MQGSIGGFFSVGLQRYAQSANYAFGPYKFKGDYQVRDDLGYGIHWIQPLWAPLSLQLGATYETYDNQFIEEVTSGGTGFYSQDGRGTNLELSGGLRFYTAELVQRHFDPFHARNPDGALYWPRLSVDWSMTNADYRTQTRDASAGYYGYSYRWVSHDKPQWLSYQLLLPLAPKVSVSAVFQKEMSWERQGEEAGVAFSESHGGRYETQKLGLGFYSSWWTIRDKAPYPYVPGVGFDGQACTTFEVSQTYDLARQRPLNQGYGFTWTQALQYGLALGVQYRVYHVEDSYFDRQMTTVTKDQLWTQTLTLGFEYGWGVWDKRPS